MKLVFFVALIVLMASPIYAHSARADTNIDNCTNITVSDTYLLTEDITAPNDYYCFNILTGNLTLDCQNHLIDGGGTYDWYVISADSVSNITVKNCRIYNIDNEGIDIENSNNVNILNNMIENISLQGIYFYNIHDALLSNNTIINSITAEGIKLDGGPCYNISIVNNTIKGNYYSGIWISNSYNNSVINNTANNNQQMGIATDTGSPNNTFIGNIIINNTAYTGSGFLAGLQLDSANETAFYNIIQDNYRGIEECGDYDGNLVYNTLLNNSMENGYPSPNCGNLSNSWNTTRQSGTRIYSNGTEIGGNYWTNSTGNGYSDTCIDANTDGFCDVPYDVGNSTGCDVDCGPNTDYLPLSPLYEEPPCVPSWNCTAWSVCVRGYQTRECTDDNKCGDNRTKPVESQVCFVGLPNATFNITDSCCPISQYYCTNNETLVQLWNTSEGVSWAVAECAYGCDNVTSSCSPAPYEANIWTLAIIIGIIIAIAALYRWSRR